MGGLEIRCIFFSDSPIIFPLSYYPQLLQVYPLIFRGKCNQTQPCLVDYDAKNASNPLLLYIRTDDFPTSRFHLKNRFVRLPGREGVSEGRMGETINSVAIFYSDFLKKPP